MYFTNIADKEVSIFHNHVKSSLKISLTDILSSDLFYVEPIIANTIYRIIPLFYFDSINSSNPNDEILDNTCIITLKTDDETYYNFNTYGIENFSHDPSASFKEISDNLSVDELNALICLLRDETVFSEDITMKEVSVTGLYGDYEFKNYVNHIMNDKGLIVNNALNNNPITVELKNPYFDNAEYVLKCRISSISNVNLDNENSINNIIVSYKEFVLKENTDVALDFSDMVEDSIVDFDMTVSVSFNVPEISSNDFNLVLSCNKQDPKFGEEVTITATLNSANHSVEGHTVVFTHVGDDNVVATTNSQGKASINVTARSIGVESVFASCMSSNAQVNYRPVANQAYVECTGSGSTTPTFNGVLTLNNNGLSNKNINVHDNNVLVSTVTTDNNGAFTYILSDNTPGVHTLKFEYSGEYGINGVGVVNSVELPKWDSHLVLTVEDSFTTDESITFGFNLLDDNNIKIHNRNVEVYFNNEHYTFNTQNNSRSRTVVYGKVPAGEYAIKLVFEGDDTYNPCEISQNMVVYNE